jgi:chromosome segregation protein
MYLKSLQVVGFKSFADRTIVNFAPGVTAIVGPNGCGKSNVLDSIRWVLGEQSAKALRGGEMKDVIFSGSDKRKALGMAEVSLTFSDCEKQLGIEYNEMTITRRIFRDGQSEYEMNKTPCRLRDIHQLFMDTGIGRSAYSIMEQGKIDMILSSRPEDRRAIFEEAAGITKYKSQKREALRKLEHTESNLVRIADIIREVKRQIGSLQRQAGKARRYREGLEALSSLESKLARHQFDIFQTEINRLQEEVSSTKSRQDEMTVQLETEEGELREARKNLETVEARINQLRNEHNLAINASERSEQRRQTNIARVTEFTDLRERCIVEVSGTQEKIKAQEEQLQYLNTQLEQSAANRKAAEEAYEAQREEVQMLNARISAAEAERAEQEEIVLKLEGNLNSARNQLAALELQQKNFLFRVENLRTEIAGIESKRNQAREQLQSQANQVAASEEQLAASRSSLQELRSEEESAQTAVKESEAAQKTASGKLQSLKARKDALVQLASSHAGSTPGAQTILNAVSKGELTAALQGTLSDHIQVQAGYEAPIALLLGEAINALVVADRQSVESIIEKLKSGKNSQCQLAALDLGRAVPPATSAPTHALKFIQHPEAIEALLASMLADCHIVDSLAAAYDFKNLHPEAIVATKSGEILTRAGLIGLGRQEGDTLAVLARRNEIEQLDKDIAPLETEAATLAEASEQAHARVLNCRSRFEEQRTKIQETEIAAATLRQAQKGVEKIVEELDHQLETANREIAHLTSQDQVDHEKHAALTASLNEQLARIEEAKKTIDGASSRIASLAMQESELNNRLTEQKIVLATQTQQVESWQQQREPVAARLIELRELVEKRTQEASDYERRTIQAQEEITLAEQEGAAAQTKQAELSTLLEQEQLARTSALASIEEKDSVLRAKRKEFGELQATRSQHEIRLAQHQMVLDALRERMRRNYQTELEALPAIVLAEGEAEPDWPTIEAEVTEKRAALDAMGPVNLDAITEYDELEQRHTFLETQQNDLINAKEQLLQAITHINQTTKQLFAETFEKVKVNFQEMFTELFGGGKATLVLQDDSDPLECGIEIVARPPGKQPQSVTLLSGGEKTMTAVALLFAIYMVKPSPFCVLDEMDAPLDESNINRFIKILKRFIGQSQFVVITHNKRTISMADVLYGVTMEEHGVSKLVSVKLNKFEKAPKTNMGTVAVDPAVPSIAESFGKVTEVQV